MKPHQKQTYLFRARSFIAKHGVLLVLHKSFTKSKQEIGSNYQTICFPSAPRGSRSVVTTIPSHSCSGRGRRRSAGGLIKWRGGVTGGGGGGGHDPTRRWWPYVIKRLPPTRRHRDTVYQSGGTGSGLCSACCATDEAGHTRLFHGTIDLAAGRHITHTKRSHGLAALAPARL